MNNNPEQGCVDYYIVRIYRRGKTTMAGVVETVGDDGKNAFANQEELWRILGRQKGADGMHDKKRKKAG